MKKIYIIGLLGLLLFSCNPGPKNPADLVFINGVIYTLDEANPKTG
jgi:hypothetical protein